MPLNNWPAKTDLSGARVAANIGTADDNIERDKGEKPFGVTPEIDLETCWQAVRSRDRRFDGRFFAGVFTTDVYCRPICPIPLRKPSNVRWYVSTASAEAAGFRPCRRCRPHTSPGTLAGWKLRQSFHVNLS
jgi:Metal binding domain of Ada